jgi:hypothetical protein
MFGSEISGGLMEVCQVVVTLEVCFAHWSSMLPTCNDV